MTGQTHWRCKVCGHIHEGATPPDECPICGAPAEEFEPCSGVPVKDKGREG